MKNRFEIQEIQAAIRNHAESIVNNWGIDAHASDRTMSNDRRYALAADRIAERIQVLAKELYALAEAQE